MKNNTEKIIIFILLVFTLIINLINSNITANIESKVIVSFLINIVISIVAIIIDNRKYSINKFFWFFNYFFLCLSPLIQYLEGVKLWHVSISGHKYFITNLLITLWFSSYLFTYYFYSIKKDKSSFLKQKNENVVKENKEVNYLNNRISKKYLLLSSTSFFILIIYIISAGNLINLMTIRTNFISTGSDDLDVVINISLKAIVVFSLTYMCYDYQKSKNSAKLIFIILNIFITIILCWLNNGRWFIGMVYIGLFVVFFESKIKGRILDIIAIISIGLIFPFLQLFKYYSLNQIFSGMFEYKGMVTMMSNNVDFDAYSIIPRTIDYIKTNGLKPGLQLLTSLLYFIPRSIWSWKSFPSGVLIGETNPSSTWSNLSCPLIAEGIFNFGIIGVPIFAFVYGIIVSYFDNKYWKNDNKTDPKCNINYIYPYLLGLMFVTNRGSLQFFINFTIAFYLPIIICYILKKFLKVRDII